MRMSKFVKLISTPMPVVEVDARRAAHHIGEIMKRTIEMELRVGVGFWNALGMFQRECFKVVQENLDFAKESEELIQPHVEELINSFRITPQAKPAWLADNKNDTAA